MHENGRKAIACHWFFILDRPRPVEAVGTPPHPGNNDASFRNCQNLTGEVASGTKSIDVPESVNGWVPAVMSCQGKIHDKSSVWKIAMTLSEYWTSLGAVASVKRSGTPSKSPKSLSANTKSRKATASQLGFEIHWAAIYGTMFFCCAIHWFLEGAYKLTLLNHVMLNAQVSWPCLFGCQAPNGNALATFLG